MSLSFFTFTEHGTGKTIIARFDEILTIERANNDAAYYLAGDFEMFTKFRGEDLKLQVGERVRYNEEKQAWLFKWEGEQASADCAACEGTVLTVT